MMDLFYVDNFFIKRYVKEARIGHFSLFESCRDIVSLPTCFMLFFNFAICRKRIIHKKGFS